MIIEVKHSYSPNKHRNSLFLISSPNPEILRHESFVQAHIMDSLDHLWSPPQQRTSRQSALSPHRRTTSAASANLVASSEQAQQRR